MTFSNKENKHLLIIGNSKLKRKKYVDELISKTNKVVYRFQYNLNSFDNYIEQVREIFPFVPLGWKEQNPKKWSLDQIWDFHLDWTNYTSGILIILEEFEKIEEEWKMEIIRDYLITSYWQEKEKTSKLNFQLIITLRDKKDLIEKIIPKIGLHKNEKRTQEQVVKGKLEVINLDWL